MNKKIEFFYNIFLKRKKLIIFSFVLINIILFIHAFILIFFDKDHAERIKPIAYLEKNIIYEKLQLDTSLFPQKNLNSFFGIEDFLKKLDVYSYANRFEDEEKKYFLSIEKGRGKRINLNEKIFIDFGKRYFISDVETDFSILFEKISNNFVFLEIEAEYIDHDFEKKKKVFKEKIAINEKSLEQVDISLSMGIEDLEKGSFLKPDVYFDICKEKKAFLKKKGKYRFIFKNAPKIYISKGDYFIYKNSMWQQLIEKADANRFPLMQIKDILESKAIIYLWSPEYRGKKELRLVNKVKNHPSVISTNDNFITDINIRNRTSISFSIDQRRFFLFEKEMLIKRKNRWEKIDFFNLNINADEFFLFDKIEKKENGKYLIGYLINSDRTVYKKIEKLISLKQKSIRRN